MKSILFIFPVLVVGIILAIAAITLGFYGIKVLMNGIFEKKDK